MFVANIGIQTFELRRSGTCNVQLRLVRPYGLQSPVYGPCSTNMPLPTELY